MNQDWVNDWYALGVITDVEPGAVIRKRLGQIEFALFNVDGDFFARANVCDACGQSLSDGRIKKSEVECSGCGLRFQIAPNSGSSAPAVYPVMIVGEEIFVWIETASDDHLP